MTRPEDRAGAARDEALLAIPNAIVSRIGHRSSQTASQRPQTARKGHRLKDRAGAGGLPGLVTSEADFSVIVEGMLDLFGWRWAHFRPAMNRRGIWQTPMAGCAGFPDYVAVRGDRLLCFELKSETGKATPEQRIWLDAMARAGAGGHLFRPSDFEAVRELLE